ncbi:MAG: flagellar basal-body rod protein FlgG [Deltaproteobacteria bacterium]|nr:flagellar basal-body rod protein FlgG [Deltaproteobacteria bacterium]
MIRSMHSAASGMEAMQTQIDVIANNMANVNTTGFKRSRAEFTDLLYQQMRQATAAGARRGANQGAPAPLEVGVGTRLVATQKIYEIGDLKQTGNPLDLAIEGDGFFRVRNIDDSLAYTRAGDFKITAQGQIVTTGGHPLDPPLFVPPDATSITIDPTGVVKALVPGDVEPVEVGQIELSQFTNPTGLKSLGKNLLAETEASGRAILGTPGQEGLGALAQGMLETSNVEVVEEMIDLIAAQRAYEINSRVIRAADEMLAEAAQLR